MMSFRSQPRYLAAILLMAINIISTTNGAPDYEKIVWNSWSACCSRKIVTTTDGCPQVSAVARGKGNGSLFIFRGDSYSIVDSVRKNGFPVIKKILSSEGKTTDFTKGASSASKAVMGRNGTIVFVGANNKYFKLHLDSNEKPQSGYDLNCSSVAQTSPFLCHPHQTSRVLDSLMTTPDGQGGSHIWSWFLAADGSKGREVIVRSTDGKVLATLSEPLNVQTVAIEVYNEADNYVSGFDFREDGLVHPFLVPFGALSQFREYQKLLQNPGLGSQVFAGCPQPFCHNADLDGSYFDHGRGVLELFRGQYYWTIKADGNPPFETPLPDSAKLIANYPRVEGMVEFPAYIDAVVMFGNSILVFKDNQVFTDKVVTLGEFFKSVGASEVSEGDVDAIWLNKFESKMYIFRSDEYYVLQAYEHNKTLAAAHPLAHDFGDFQGVAKYIDAAFSLTDGCGYLFKGNWYYKVPEKEWLPSNIPYGAQLALGSRAQEVGFWNTQEACGLSDQDFDALQLEMPLKYGPKNGDELPIITTTAQAPSTTAKPTTKPRPNNETPKYRDPSDDIDEQHVPNKPTSKSKSVLIGLGVGLLVLLILVAVVVFTLSKKKKKSRSTSMQSFGPSELGKSKSNDTNDTKEVLYQARTVDFDPQASHGGSKYSIE